MPADPKPRRSDVTAVELVGGTEKRHLVLADYDPDWPDWYANHERRISTVLGPEVRVEHIGSTSVPGLAAKPILDILVTVHDITAEEDYSINSWPLATNSASASPGTA